MNHEQITKSSYSAGIQCAKRLYLLAHENQKTAPSEDVQLRFTQGQAIGKIAQASFPDGVLISESGNLIDRAIERTAKEIKSLVASAIFEGAFACEKLLIRVDVLKNNYDGTWNLIEVKSTTSVKPQHLDDVAFQLYVLKKCGLQIRNVILRYINKQVTYPNLNDFFIDHDMTDQAEQKLSEVEASIRLFGAIIAEDQPPEVKIGKQCGNPYNCEFKDRCWADVPKGSTLELYNYRKRKPTKYDLFHNGPKLIQDLNGEVELTKLQEIQRLASTSEEPIINHHGLMKFLDEVKYPLYYFDFETIAPVVPVLEGMRPYQRIPVQWSCHIQERPGAPLVHREFLASGEPGIDPRRECIDAMKEVFSHGGTAVAYHDSFEKSLIRELAQSFPEDHDFLMEVEGKFWDLEDAFHEHYYHRDFAGSMSIKSVLPYFAPEMSYKNLEVQNGGQAQAQLFKLLSGELDDLEKQIIRKSLLKYCEQDTMAMVVIHRALMKASVRTLKPYSADSKRSSRFHRQTAEP